MPTSTALPVAPPPGPPKPPPGYHGAVTEFKRRLIEATLFQLGGNRTRTARALGLQRTYLLRLIREFGVNVPRQEAMSRPPIGGAPAPGGNGAPRRPSSPPPETR